MSDNPTPPPSPRPRPDHAMPKGPAQPEVTDTAAEETPAAPPPKSLDLHRLPSGHLPEAWKNLPPPTIIRAKPKPEKTKGQQLQELLRQRLTKQILIGLGALLLLILIAWSFIPRSSTATHLGTITLFARGLEARDPAALREVTTGMAQLGVDGLLQTIADMEAQARASRFTTATPTTGGAPTSDTTNGYVTCEGENGDDFLRVNLVLQRQADGTWRISEMGSEDLTGSPGMDEVPSAGEPIATP